jgi:hypothetical protein
MDIVRRGLVITLAAVFAACAWVPVTQASSARSILDDAMDGRVDGTYSASQVRAAIKLARSDPFFSQYSDVDGVLADYLAGLNPPRTDAGGTSPVSAGQTVVTPTPKAVVPVAGDSPRGDSKPHPSARPGGGRRDVAVPLPSPLLVDAGWDQAGVRLAASPWFFVVIGGASVGSMVLLRRRR